MKPEFNRNQQPLIATGLHVTSLEIADVEAMVKLLAEASDPTVQLTIIQRKRALVKGVADLIAADVYVWSTSYRNPEVDHDSMSTCIIDGGWQNDRQQALVYEALTDTAFTKDVLGAATATAIEMRYVTFLRQDLCDDETWAKVGSRWRQTGLDNPMLCIYPLANDGQSGIGFHRLIGKPNFTERERAIVHTLFSQVRWLHEQGVNEPAKDTVIQLTPRQRQVLVLILQGDSKKLIAGKLEISEHTVGDFMKQLHKIFSVNSRAELQGIFLTGQSSNAGDD